MPELFPSKPNRIPIQIAQKMAQVLHQKSGISVRPENQAFLELRMSRRAREMGVTLDEYLDLFNGPIGDSEGERLVEMLATHTTDFFREPAHFHTLESRSLPDLLARGAGRDYPLTVWSAACSIGSELWSAGMVLGQFAAKVSPALRFSLRGTDISGRVVRRAQDATYSEDEIRGIPEALRRTYLLRARAHAAHNLRQSPYRISPDLRQMAQFQTFNLVRPTESLDFAADVIFLRNVLIYFSLPDQVAALGTVFSHLRMGGYLFLGHSEQLPRKIPGLVQIGPATYQRTQDVE